MTQRDKSRGKPREELHTNNNFVSSTPSKVTVGYLMSVHTAGIE